jgi:hypothetical protein
MQPSSVMICCPSIRCKRVVSPEWHFCAHCGQDLRPPGLSRPDQEECSHHYELVGSHCTLCGFDSQPMWGLEDWQRIGLGIACFPIGFFLMVMPYLVQWSSGPRAGGSVRGTIVVVGCIIIAIGAALLLKIKNSFKM